jgi:dynein heavy chain
MCDVAVAGGPVEEAQMLLDDHVVKSQAMVASPFSKPFEERLVPWEGKLRRFQVCAEQSMPSHARCHASINAN